MRRELGNGRWDKILIRKMTELSVADNYEEAKEEWIATGDVWWSGNGDMPDWVSQSEHRNYCLCGHGIVYHFRIRNTENGNEEIVGSDHINSYLIMRQIAQELKVDIDTITDEQVELWLKERVGSMKAEAWWAENGATFEFMFNRVREIDLWYNTHRRGYYYDTKYQRQEIKRVLRKKANSDGMASIVWRWNHPNNPKAQINTRGYPNEKLMTDLAWFFGESLMMRDRFTEWKEERAKRLEFLEELRRQQAINHASNQERRRLAAIEWEKGREERERKQREENEKRKARNLEIERKQQEAKMSSSLSTLSFPVNDHFDNMCGFYGIPVFDASMGGNAWETNFLADTRNIIENKKELSQGQLRKLKDIFEVQPPTEKQVKYLKDLGWDGEIPNRRFASNKISELKGD